MKIMKLGDIATYINGYAFKPEQWTTEGKKIIRIQNLNNPSASYNYFDQSIDDKYIVKKGDILISWSASIGAYEWRLEEAVLNQHIFKVQFDKINIDKNYFRFMVEIALVKAMQYMHGSTMKHITKKYFDEIKIPVPTLEKQKEITKVLEQFKRMSEHRKEQIDLLNELVKSKFIEMFGEPFENTKGWSKETLKQIVTDDCTISYGIVQTGEEQKKGIPVFRPVDIVNNKKPKLNELKKTTKEISDKYKKTLLYGNEMLITVRANIGDICIIGEEFKGCNVGRGIVPLKFQNKINSIFLKGQFESYRVQQELRALAKGITLIQLNMEDLREFKVIVPPIAFQNQFAEFVQQVDKLKFEMEKSLKELQDNFDSLMQRAFNGELFK